MEIEWLPVYSRTNNRTLEVQAVVKDSSIEIWSYRIDLEVRYYFTILKFQTIDNISIGKRITQFLDFADGFDSLEQCQDFVKKNWDAL
jgi:hypothetical protein